MKTYEVTSVCEAFLPANLPEKLCTTLCYNFVVQLLTKLLCSTKAPSVQLLGTTRNC